MEDSEFKEISCLGPVNIPESIVFSITFESNSKKTFPISKSFIGPFQLLEFLEAAEIREGIRLFLSIEYSLEIGFVKVIFSPKSNIFGVKESSFSEIAE